MMEKLSIIHSMDKEKLILDSESFKAFYRKEKRAKTILLILSSFAAIITGASIVMAFVAPQNWLQNTTSSIDLFKVNANERTKVLSIIETIDGQASRSAFRADFALLLPTTAKAMVAENKPATKSQTSIETSVAKQTQQKKEDPKAIQTPKPASSQNQSSKPTPKPIAATSPKVVQQTKPAAPKTPTNTKQPAKPKTPSKPEKKTNIAGRYDNVDPIPIPAMAIRPPDANYGIPENWPLSSPVSVPYGYRPERGRFHSGVDLDAEVGVPVEAAGAGKIIRAEWYAGYGMCVDIEHANGYVTRYGHLSQIYVTKGQWVEVGEWIGANGNTGNSSAPHVHFEVHQNGHSIDPEGINWTIRKMPPKAY